MNKLLKKIYASSVILALFANQLVPAIVYAQETTNSQNTATTAVTPTTSDGVTTQETTTSDSNAENASAATVGIAQIGKVKVTTANTTGEAPQYTTARRQGTISLDGSRLEQPVTGGYIEIKYPVDYIESFSVSTGSPVVKTDNSTPGVIKVYLSDITQTTSASLPFSFKFKDIQLIIENFTAVLQRMAGSQNLVIFLSNLVYPQILTVAVKLKTGEMEEHKHVLLRLLL